MNNNSMFGKLTNLSNLFGSFIGGNKKASNKITNSQKKTKSPQTTKQVFAVLKRDDEGICVKGGKWFHTKEKALSHWSPVFGRMFPNDTDIVTVEYTENPLKFISVSWYSTSKYKYNSDFLEEVLEIHKSIKGKTLSIDDHAVFLSQSLEWCAILVDKNVLNYINLKSTARNLPKNQWNLFIQELNDFILIGKLNEWYEWYIKKGVGNGMQVDEENGSNSSRKRKRYTLKAESQTKKQHLGNYRYVNVENQQTPRKVPLIFEIDDKGEIDYKGGRFLVIDSDLLLNGGFESVENKDNNLSLYIRDCYIDLFDVVMYHHKKSINLFHVCGTKGIGKTTFLNVFLIKLVAEFLNSTKGGKIRTLVDKVMHDITFDYGENKINIDTSTGMDLKDVLDDFDFVENNNNWLLYDPGANGAYINEENLNCNIIVTSSYDATDKYFKADGLRLKAIKLWMYPWKFEEAEHVYKTDNLEEKFKTYGGVSRSLTQEFNAQNNNKVTLKIKEAIDKAIHIDTTSVLRFLECYRNNSLDTNTNKGDKERIDKLSGLNHAIHIVPKCKYPDNRSNIQELSEYYETMQFKLLPRDSKLHEHLLFEAAKQFVEMKFDKFKELYEFPEHVHQDYELLVKYAITYGDADIKLHKLHVERKEQNLNWKESKETDLLLYKQGEQYNYLELKDEENAPEKVHGLNSTTLIKADVDGNKQTDIDYVYLKKDYNKVEEMYISVTTHQGNGTHSDITHSCHPLLLLEWCLSCMERGRDFKYVGVIRKMDRTYKVNVNKIKNLKGNLEKKVAHIKKLLQMVNSLLKNKNVNDEDKAFANKMSTLLSSNVKLISDVNHLRKEIAVELINKFGYFVYVM